MAAHSFIADNSKPSERTFRLSLAGFCWGFATPIGTLLGAILFSDGGYKCVYAARFVTILLNFILFMLRLWNFEEKGVQLRRESAFRGDAIVSKRVPYLPRTFDDLKKEENQRKLYFLTYFQVLVQRAGILYLKARILILLPT